MHFQILKTRTISDHWTEGILEENIVSENIFSVIRRSCFQKAFYDIFSFLKRTTIKQFVKNFKRVEDRKTMGRMEKHFNIISKT